MSCRWSLSIFQNVNGNYLIAFIISILFEDFYYIIPNLINNCPPNNWPPPRENKDKYFPKKFSKISFSKKVFKFSFLSVDMKLNTFEVLRRQFLWLTKNTLNFTGWIFSTKIYRQICGGKFWQKRFPLWNLTCFWLSKKKQAVNCCWRKWG